MKSALWSKSRYAMLGAGGAGSSLWASAGCIGSCQACFGCLGIGGLALLLALLAQKRGPEQNNETSVAPEG